MTQCIDDVAIAFFYFLYNNRNMILATLLVLSVHDSNTCVCKEGEDTVINPLFVVLIISSTLESKNLIVSYENSSVIPQLENVPSNYA